MAKFDSPYISPATPRMGNKFLHGLGKLMFKMVGWKITGRLPDEKKVILVGFPHTSNWDFYLAMAFMFTLGVKFTWMMKKEAFFWPVGPLWKKMGGIPIDRKSKTDITGQVAQWIENTDNVLLGITPEGTRSSVKHYKKGYLRIANASQAPLFIVGLRGDRKEVILDKLWPLTGDVEADNAALKAYVDNNYVGIRPEKA